MSKNIVFMVNIKNEGNESRSNPYIYSIKSWEKWCDKNDCELFVLTERIYDKEIMNPNWHKLFVFDLLENEEIDYNQILIVDSDTIVHPDCPNFFEETDNKFCAVHNEGSYDWVCRSIENYSKYLFDGFTFPLYEYFNSGFLIINKNHKKLYKDVVNFYLENRENIVKIQETFGVGTDQPVLNFFVQKENIDLKILPYEFNMQDMFRKEIIDNDLTFIQLGWIYHYNAIPQEFKQQTGDVEYWMKKTYENFYGGL